MIAFTLAPVAPAAEETLPITICTSKGAVLIDLVNDDENEPQKHKGGACHAACLSAREKAPVKKSAC